MLKIVRQVTVEILAAIGKKLRLQEDTGKSILNAMTQDLKGSYLVIDFETTMH